jgi:hypothetical protein
VGSGVGWRSGGRRLPREASGQRARSLVTPASERGQGEVGLGLPACWGEEAM